MKEYKILTQKDRFFGGKFNPDSIEKAINSYAGEGWVVKGVTSASFPGFLNKAERDELIIVMERDK